MARVYDEINDQLHDWVARQSMFFVATAPFAGDGHVNVSPKGPIGSLRVLSPQQVAYLDVTGSGTETIAHLRENGRICIMLCAFEGAPRIVRFHGHGEVVPHGTAEFDDLIEQAQFQDPSLPGARRSIILVRVTRVSDSCGYGVPLMRFNGLREHHALSTAKKQRTLGESGYLANRAQREHDTVSLDGLPALGPEL